jgi:hypothetical protein
VLAGGSAMLLSSLLPRPPMSCQARAMAMRKKTMTRTAWVRSAPGLAVPVSR